MAEIRDVFQDEELKNAAVGDTILFGSYEQDDDPDDNGLREPLEWVVLASENNKLLLLSKNAISCQPFNTAAGDVTWETSSLRTWMNETFVNEAFNPDEVDRIAVTLVSADSNDAYNVSSGSSTEDRVFALSIKEAAKYFANDAARMCVPTVHANSEGTYTDDQHSVEGEPSCWWWLRSPGSSNAVAADVRPSGEIFAEGGEAEILNVGARPAMWVQIPE